MTELPVEIESPFTQAIRDHLALKERNADLENAAGKVGERIRRAVEMGLFQWEGKTIPVTISLGVSTLHTGENIPDLMVRRADEALYDAKRAGKNRVATEKRSFD